MALNHPKRTFESFSELFGESSLFSEAPQPFKRARQHTEPSLWNQILFLPHSTTQSLLYQICNAHPSLSSFVTSAHNARVAAEAARPPVNFDHYSRDCWHTMNRKYKHLSGGQQCQMMGDICQVLDESRDAIVEAAGPGVRWETRRNALEVLRKICKSVMLCDEPQIRHELMKDGVMLGQFADSMQELARGMTDVDRARYRQEGLYEKLWDLQKECDPIFMEGLSAVYMIFDGEEFDDDEDEDEDEEDAEEEEEEEEEEGEDEGEDEDEDCYPDSIEEANLYAEDEDEESEEEDINRNAASIAPGRQDYSSHALH